MDKLTAQTIGRRINSTLAVKDMMQKELAEILGITPNTISYFVKGDRTPNIEQITKICKKLNISADYILGISNVPTRDAETQAICDKTKLTEGAVQKLCDWGKDDVPFFSQFAKFYSAFICDVSMTGMLAMGMERYFNVKENGISEDSEFSSKEEALNFYKFQIEQAIMKFVSNFFEVEYSNAE